MEKIKYYWIMKKPGKPLILDSFKVAYKKAHKYFEINKRIRHSKTLKGDIYACEICFQNVREAIKKNVKRDINYPLRIAKKL